MVQFVAPHLSLFLPQVYSRLNDNQSHYSVTGGNGRVADQRTHQRSRMAVHYVLSLHDSTSGCSYFRPHDQHIPSAQYRRRQQTPFHQASDRIAPRTNEGLRRVGLGLLHRPGAVPIPGGGGHLMLGQILGFFDTRRHGRHHHRNSCPNHIHNIRLPFLS